MSDEKDGNHSGLGGSNRCENGQLPLSYRQEDVVLQLIRGELTAAIGHLQFVRQLAHAFQLDGQIEEVMLRNAIGTIRDIPKHCFRQWELPSGDELLNAVCRRGCEPCEPPEAATTDES